MSDEKTLGQVYFDASFPADKWLGVSKIRQQEYDLLGAGIAAVCRAVLAEREPPEPEAASEAGDWAMEAWLESKRLFTGTGQNNDDECANAISLFGNQYYAPRFADLQMKLLEANNKLLEKTGTPSQLEHAKRLADRLDETSQRVTQLQGYLIALADEVGASYPLPMADETFAANIMAATIKTVQERDAAVAEVAKRPDERSCLAALMAIGESLGLTGIVNPGDTVKAVESMKAERDKLAAELAIAVSAIAWADTHYCHVAAYNRGVLTAFRATKGKEQGDGR